MKGFKQGAQTGGLLEHGTKVLGFKKGGQVKASPDFVMKTKSTGNPSDKGNMPKSEGDSEQEKEAGGRQKVRPGYKEGGYVACRRGGVQCYKKGGKYYMKKGGKMVPMRDSSGYRTGDPGGGKQAKKGRGKGVVKGKKVMEKAKGGRVNGGPSGAKSDPADKNRVTGASPGEGDHVPAQGRGAKPVGKGGHTGKHRKGRLRD